MSLPISASKSPLQPLLAQPLAEGELLDMIRSPKDLRKLSLDDLHTLAGEMRHRIVEAVSKNGGHLASNLGVVELTLALHYVYDFGPYPKGPDRLLWDVGIRVMPTRCSPVGPGISRCSARRGM